MRPVGFFPHVLARSRLGARSPLLPVARKRRLARSEEHTTELQSGPHRVCRLLLEKKNENTRARRSYVICTHPLHIDPTALHSLSERRSSDSSSYSSKLALFCPVLFDRITTIRLGGFFPHVLARSRLGVKRPLLPEARKSRLA